MITQSLCDARNSSSPPGADEFLPVLIFVVVKTNVSDLISSLSYICSYRNPELFLGKANYFLTQIYSAVTFIESINQSSLFIDPVDYRIWMGKEIDKNTKKIDPKQQKKIEKENEWIDQMDRMPTLTFCETEFDDLIVTDLPVLLEQYQALRARVVFEIKKQSDKV
eukprot:c17380_g1_i6.p1 GENE.c17380_g1_i6~~c17380_g1_i6.p1  ORF type:complete len:166 (+),score=57.80 c17380_g1_i6:21-518(+)